MPPFVESTLFKTRPAVRIGNGQLSATILTGGGHIALVQRPGSALADDAAGARTARAGGGGGGTGRRLRRASIIDTAQSWGQVHSRLGATIYAQRTAKIRYPCYPACSARIRVR